MLKKMWTFQWTKKHLTVVAPVMPLVKKKTTLMMRMIAIEPVTQSVRLDTLSWSKLTSLDLTGTEGPIGLSIRAEQLNRSSGASRR